ncbi:hypothetical protein GCM10027299_18330 [Larkinella ripae]
MKNQITVHEYFVIEATNTSTNLGGHQFSTPLHKGDFVSVLNKIYEVTAVVVPAVSEINRPDKLQNSEFIVHNGGDLIVTLVGNQSDFYAKVEAEFAII